MHTHMWVVGGEGRREVGERRRREVLLSHSDVPFSFMKINSLSEMTASIEK